MNYLDNLVNNKQIQNLLDTIFDAIYIVDTTRTIKFWNKGAENVTGLKKTKLSKKNVPIIFFAILTKQVNYCAKQLILW
jgi:PAS domain S-box-containing protein